MKISQSGYINLLWILFVKNNEKLILAILNRRQKISNDFPCLSVECTVKNPWREMQSSLKFYQGFPIPSENTSWRFFLDEETEFRTNFRYLALSLVNILSVRSPFNCWILKVATGFKFSHEPSDSLFRPDEISLDRASKIGKLHSNFPPSCSEIASPSDASIAINLLFLWIQRIALALFVSRSLIRRHRSKIRRTSSLIVVEGTKFSCKLRRKQKKINRKWEQTSKKQIHRGIRINNGRR